MKRLALIATLTTFAAPASALAATGHGVVLSNDSRHHTIQIVDSSHAVHAYRVRGRLGKLRAGSVVSFRARGRSISALHSLGRAHTISYYAKVVRTSRQHVVLRLADGHTVNLKASSRKAGRGRKATRRAIARMASTGAGAGAPAVTINIQGLVPGSTVLVTEAIAPDGSITLTITLPSTTTANEQSVDGVVSDVEDNTFTVDTADGSSLVFHMAAKALDAVDMTPCDTVTVTYHSDAGMLVADNVDDTGTSDQGDCASDGSGDSGDGSTDTSDSSSDETGPVTAVSSSSITIDTPDQGSMTFAVDPTSGLTDGFQPGDVVDVTYAAASGGAPQASDVEYVEDDVVGAVTAVDGGSVTLTNADTGSPVTFTADVSEQMFQGVAVGDQIDVTFHVAGGQQVVDNVDDQTADGAS
jgi:hypothetical protein